MVRVPHLASAEALQATYVAQVFPRHTHEEFAIGVVDQGVHVSEWGGATHRAGAGTIVVNNPGDVHTGRALDRAGWSYRMLYPPAALLTDAALQLAERHHGLPAFGAPVLHDPAAAVALGALVSALLDGAPALETHTRFLEVCAMLLRRHAVARPGLVPLREMPAAVRRAREYLHAHLADPVSLAALAAEVGLHPLYLVRVFRRAVGVPPHAYHTQLRVAQAKRRLAAGEPPVVVAAAVGFADQSHLTRHFRRLVGVPPGQYARAVGSS